jgi:hypothetical protein
MPMIIRLAPSKATYLRPRRSESEPTKGQTAARAKRFASICRVSKCQIEMDNNIQTKSIYRFLLCLHRYMVVYLQKGTQVFEIQSIGKP